MDNPYNMNTNTIPGMPESLRRNELIINSSLYYLSGKNDFHVRQSVPSEKLEIVNFDLVETLKESMYMSIMNEFLKVKSPEVKRLENPIGNFPLDHEEVYQADAYIFTEEELKDFVKRVVFAVDERDPYTPFR